MARHKEIRLLMIKFQPSCICLQKVMLENVMYNLERKYNFYATISPGQTIKWGTAVAIRKEIAHKRLNIRTTLQVVVLEVYLVEKRKRTICLIYLSPTEQMTEEDMKDFLCCSQYLWYCKETLLHTIHCGEVKKWAQNGEC